MERNDFLLAATLLCVCLLVAAGFHSSVSNEQTAASWVQAVGTIGAVWAAIWVAGEERRRQRADWTGQSIMFAGGLLAPMSQLAFECTRVRRALAMAQRPPDLRGPGPADVFANAQFIIPERLQYAMEIMHQFDPQIVGRIQTCLTSVTSFNVVLEQLTFTTSRSPFVTDDERLLLERLVPTLEVIAGQLEALTGMSRASTQ